MSRSARPRRLTFALGAALALALAYGVLLAYLYVSQERMIFAASKLAADHVFRFDHPFDEVMIDVPGATLHALHFRQPNPDGLVFFLHGNAGDVSTWATDIDFYRAVNYDFFLVDYRGYGKSTGSIASEAQLHADVRAAWDRVAPRYRGKPIVVHGRSLGTGLAVTLARDVDPALVVLVTPYKSLAAVVGRLYPIAPGWLLKYPLRTDAAAPGVRAPVVILHGTHDELLPLAETAALQPLFRPEAELVVVDGAAHNDIQDFAVYRDTLARRLRALAAGSPPTAHAEQTRNSAVRTERPPSTAGRSEP